jgi:hypothetical protein
MPPAVQTIWETMKTLQTMACAIAFAMPQLVAAQAAPETPAAATAASQLPFQSAFADYKPYEDVPVADWREVNETVKKAAEKGGVHAGHGSQEPSAAEDKAPAAANAPSPAPRDEHMGHSMHGGRP